MGMMMGLLVATVTLKMAMVPTNTALLTILSALRLNLGWIPVGKMSLLSPFHDWGITPSERSYNLPKFTQVWSIRPGVFIKAESVKLSIPRLSWVLRERGLYTKHLCSLCTRTAWDSEAGSFCLVWKTPLPSCNFTAWFLWPDYKCPFQWGISSFLL